MKKWLISLAVVLWSSIAFAAPPAVVVDSAGIFSSQEIEKLAAKIQDNYRKTGVQVVIVTLPKIVSSIEEDVILLGREWKVGKSAANNGIILAIAPNEKKTRLEIGYGLEGVLPDSKANEILRRMRPYLSKREYFNAFNTALDDLVIISIADNKERILTDPVVSTNPVHVIWYIALGLGVIVVIILLWYFSKSSKPPSAPTRSSNNKYNYYPPLYTRKETKSSTKPRKTEIKSKESKRSSDSGISDVLVGIAIGSLISSNDTKTESSENKTFSDDGGTFGGAGSNSDYE